MYNKGALHSCWHWRHFVQGGLLLTLLCCYHLAVCCRCHKCRSVCLHMRGWRNGAISEMQLIFAVSVQHLSVLVLIIFLSDFFFFFLGLCIPCLHLSGLRVTTAICLYFSNPPVWTAQCGDYWECVTQAANFISFFLYKHYSLPRSSHGMKYLHFNNALGRIVSPVCSTHCPLLKPK